MIGFYKERCVEGGWDVGGRWRTRTGRLELWADLEEGQHFGTFEFADIVMLQAVRAAPTSRRATWLELRAGNYLLTMAEVPVEVFNPPRKLVPLVGYEGSGMGLSLNHVLKRGQRLHIMMRVAVPSRIVIEFDLVELPDWPHTLPEALRGKL